jgi:hypothetical protein
LIGSENKIAQDSFPFLLTSLLMLPITGCGETATLPLTTGFDPIPTMILPKPTLLPLQKLGRREPRQKLQQVLQFKPTRAALNIHAGFTPYLTAKYWLPRPSIRFEGIPFPKDSPYFAAELRVLCQG